MMRINKTTFSCSFTITVLFLSCSSLAQSIFDSNAKNGNTSNTLPASQPATQSVPRPVKAPVGTILTTHDIVGYAVIPLRGEFGMEIRSAIFKTSLEACKKQGVQHIMIPIDSAGGLVQTAKEIADLMTQYSKDFKYHVWIENKALSASIWVVFNADTIHISDKGTLGAAVAYSRNNAGIAQVSAKFNSATAAEIAVLAERKGYSPALVRAMVQEGAEAYAWRGLDGNWIIDNTKPLNRPRDLVVLNNGKTILTLTAGEAQKIGFAQGCNSSAELIGQVGEKRLLKVTVYPEQLALYYRVKIAAYRNAGEIQLMTRAGDITTVWTNEALKEFPILPSIISPARSSQILKQFAIDEFISTQYGSVSNKFRTPRFWLNDVVITNADKHEWLEPRNGEPSRTMANAKEDGNKDNAQVRVLYAKAAAESRTIYDKWQTTVKAEMQRCQDVKDESGKPKTN